MKRQKPMPRKPQRNTEEHRFFSKEPFTCWATPGILATSSDLCSSVFICGIQCFFTEPAVAAAARRLSSKRPPCPTHIRVRLSPPVGNAGH